MPSADPAQGKPEMAELSRQTNHRDRRSLTIVLSIGIGMVIIVLVACLAILL